MKKRKEFIFPENVDKDYGIWKGYTLKDFDYMALTEGLGLLFIILSPYSLVLVLTKTVIVALAMVIVMVILIVKPANVRENIRA